MSNLKVPDKFRDKIVGLFKSGLTEAAKNPRKFWILKREQDDKTKPWDGFKAKKK